MTFFKPWETVDGRRNLGAYHVADTFEDALAGFKRKRKAIIFHMPNEGEAGDLPCVVCGGLLRDPNREASLRAGRTTSEGGAGTKPDRFSTWTYDPRRKTVGNGMHYLCSWSALMLDIFVAWDTGRLG